MKCMSKMRSNIRPCLKHMLAHLSAAITHLYWKWKLLSHVWLFATPWTLWNSLGQNTGVSSPSLLSGIFPNQELNLGPCIAGKFFTNWAVREAQKVKVKSQPCRTLCILMDCSSPGSSVHGIFQARILECFAIFFSRWSSYPRDRTWVSHILGRLFTVWVPRPPGVENYNFTNEKFRYIEINNNVIN